jgi:glycosyltransferase involved in cell wall biosynthesis
MSRPRAEISVAMCTYNGERYLGEQLDSIARQTILPVELVLCDDGSVDATPEIVAKFARSAPFKVNFVRNPTTLGSTKNFEQAIRLCRGELIALCDQDDFWKDLKLASLAGAFVDNSIGGVFSDGDLMDGQARKTGRTLFKAFGFTAALRAEWRTLGAAPVLVRLPVVTGATLMFRSRLKASLLPISPRWIHDAWIAWVIAAISKLEFLETPLINYRVHASQQEGVPGPTLQSRIGKALQEDAGTYLGMAQQFEDLRDHLTSIADRLSPGVLAMIEDKIRFSQFRSALSSNRVSRVHQVLARLPSYKLYSRGFREALKDVIR